MELWMDIPLLTFKIYRLASNIKMIKFSYKIGCSLKLQPFLIIFY